MSSSRHRGGVDHTRSTTERKESFVTHVKTAAELVEALLNQLEDPTLTSTDIEKIEHKINVLKPHVNE
jgi:hypothetical protein